MKLHRLPLELDNGIRRVTGPFETWADFAPPQVVGVSERGPIQLLWVISSHPSGRVRETVVHETQHLSNDRILPHLANRSIDFVPQIRELASRLVLARLDQVLSEYAGTGRTGALPTPVHIAVGKLLMPRTGIVSPSLLHRCIELAEIANMPQPRSFRGGGLARMLERCHRTLRTAPTPESRAALEALIAHFDQAPTP